MVVLLFFSLVLVAFAANPTPLEPGQGQVSTISSGLTQTWTFTTDQDFEVDVWRTTRYIGSSYLQQPSVSYKLLRNNLFVQTSSGRMLITNFYNATYVISVQSSTTYSYLVRWCPNTCPDSCPITYSGFCYNSGACINGSCLCDKVGNTTSTALDCGSTPDLGPFTGFIIIIAVVIILALLCIVCIVVLCCCGFTTAIGGIIAGIVACCASCCRKDTTRQDAQANQQYQPVTVVPLQTY